MPREVVYDIISIYQFTNSTQKYQTTDLKHNTSKYYAKITIYHQYTIEPRATNFQTKIRKF